MIQASYSTEGISDLVSNPQDRAAVRPLVEGLGGKLESFDFAFGDFDAVVILEVPNNVAMASIAMAVGASGAIASLKTTVLIPMEEAMQAMRQAGGAGYRPPGGRFHHREHGGHGDKITKTSAFSAPLR
jgi:uncharacterized protein with GYD domain